MIPRRDIVSMLSREFPHDPTADQATMFVRLQDFLNAEADTDNKNLFLLKGYAGTGKTTSVSTLVKVLPKVGLKSVLLAPTGRAAKVMSNYSGRAAYTIHKKIYKQTADAALGELKFSRQPNLHRKTVFIVDEVSMISGKADYGSRSLLQDLIDFVFEGQDNRLMFVGDTAQLPPVREELSPAFDVGMLKSHFGLKVINTELTQVTRQQQESGILYNATNLRNVISAAEMEVQFTTSGYPDIFKMTSERLEEGLRYAFDKFGEDNTVVVCRANRQAVMYNHYIRQALMFKEEELNAGDRLMIVRNNYHWLESDDGADFLANGDFVEVLSMLDTEDRYGLRFADLRLRLSDHPDQPEFNAKVILDVLHSNTANLSQEQNRELYGKISDNYADLNKKERIKAMREDPYLNALQIKYAYALTCHKAQGGQWPAVFLDQGFMRDDMLDIEFLRWLYTAVTRASEELFLVNFDAKFYERG